MSEFYVLLFIVFLVLVFLARRLGGKAVRFAKTREEVLFDKKTRKVLQAGIISAV